MSENSLWRKVRKNMAERWDEATRHEDKLNLGVCDVSFVCGGKHGWMELKHLPKWPARPGTVVRCDHYTEDQRVFLKRKGKHAGGVWLFVQIDRDHLLFDSDRAQLFGTLNTEDTLRQANVVWRGKMDWDHLREILIHTH